MKTIFRRVSVSIGTYLMALVSALPAWAADVVAVSTYDEGDFSSVFERIATSFQGAPLLIGAAAYAAGIIMAVTAIVKLRDHFDKPDHNPIRESVVRALIAGGLFAIPTIMDMAVATMGGADNDLTAHALTFGGLGSIGSAVSGLFGANACDASRATSVISSGLGGMASGGLWGGIKSAVGTYLNGGTLGQLVCYAAHSFKGLPGLLASGLYIAGIFLIFWGLLQLRDHLLAPEKVPVSAPLKRILLAGAFLSFPSIAQVARNSLGDDTSLVALDPFIDAKCGAGSTGSMMSVIGSVMSLFTGSTGSGDAGGATGGGLDCMMVRLVSDLWDPVQIAVSIFCYLAGLVIIALALRRILDGLDKGVRSPVGIGTLGMLFLGGALLSFDTIIKVVTVSLFPDFFSGLGMAKLSLYGSLNYMPGVGEDGMKSINTIITTVFAFSFLIGIISVVRGLFILKEVANGGQASLMSGFTHVLGGGMAINLGPVVNAVQNTLGIKDIGISIGSTPFGF